MLVASCLISLLWAHPVVNYRGEEIIEGKEKSSFPKLQYRDLLASEEKLNSMTLGKVMEKSRIRYCLSLESKFMVFSQRMIIKIFSTSSFGQIKT